MTKGTEEVNQPSKVWQALFGLSFRNVVDIVPGTGGNPQDETLTWEMVGKLEVKI